MADADYRKIRTRASHGPGFPKCYCCRIGSKHEALRDNNRRIRRKSKQILDKETA